MSESEAERSDESKRRGDTPENGNDGSDRRQTLGWLGKAGLAAGLTAAYGTLAAFMGRFLYPAGPPPTGWMLLSRVEEVPDDGALLYRTPAGRTVNVTRQGEGSGADAFKALSSTCPHLGCQVHWQPQNDRFFCPCHNGIFTPSGKAIGGPPGEAGQNLPEYPLKVEDGLLFIQVEFQELAEMETHGPGRVLDTPPPAPTGPGQDPCLFCSASDAPSEDLEEIAT